MESPKVKSVKVIQLVEVKTVFDLAKAAKISAGGGTTEVLIDVERAWDKMVNHTGFTPHDWLDRIIELAHVQGIGFVQVSYVPQEIFPIEIDDFFGDRHILEFGSITEPIPADELSSASKKGFWVSALVHVPLTTKEMHFEAMIALRGLKPAAEDAVFGPHHFSQVHFTVIGVENGQIHLCAIGRPM